MPHYPRIRDLREDSDLYQRDLAKVLHCSQQTYSDYECGKTDVPSEGRIALADYYKKTGRELDFEVPGSCDACCHNG